MEVPTRWYWIKEWWAAVRGDGAGAVWDGLAI